MRIRSFPKIVVVMVVIVVIFSIGITLLSSFNDHTYIATVTDKERITEDGDSYYLIFCKDDSDNFYEFKNEDSFVRGKFRSSTVYNQIEVGKTYKFTVVGFRIGLFSCYENIINFEKIND